MTLRSLFFLVLWLALSAPVVAQQPSQVVPSTRTVRIDGVSYALHSVVRKETLYSIAKTHGISVEAVTRSNPYLGKRLSVGTTVLIPIQTHPAPSPSAPTPTPSTPTPSIPTPSSKEFLPAPQAQPVAVGHTSELQADDTLPLPATNAPTVVDRIRPLTDRDQGIEVALLLPLGGRPNEAHFIEFLCGSLVASEVLQEEGVAIRLNVHSTEAAADKAHTLVSSGVLDRADVLIGPVYDAPFEVVGAWATERRVPIISPLGGSGSLDNPYVVCAAPSEKTKFDALRTALSAPSAKVSYIDCGEANDIEWAEAAAGLLPVGAARLVYQGKATHVNELTALLTREGPNVVVLPSSNEALVEAVLSRLSSINAAGRYQISVVGTPRWARFLSLNLDLFFKLGVGYTTSYHADRSQQQVALFFQRYINSFGAIPSAYAMRGYDVTVWVGRAMHASGERFLYDLPSLEGAILQTPYQFAQPQGAGSKFENVRWAWVSYRPNYTIDVQ